MNTSIYTIQTQNTKARCPDDRARTHPVKTARNYREQQWHGGFSPHSTRGTRNFFAHSRKLTHTHTPPPTRACAYLHELTHRFSSFLPWRPPPTTSSSSSSLHDTSETLDARLDACEPRVLGARTIPMLGCARHQRTRRTMDSARALCACGAGRRRRPCVCYYNRTDKHVRHERTHARQPRTTVQSTAVDRMRAPGNFSIRCFWAARALGS